MNSMWVNIVSRLHYQTQRFILNEELCSDLLNIYNSTISHERVVIRQVSS